MRKVQRIESLEELQVYLSIDQPAQVDVVVRRNDYADLRAGAYVAHVDMCNEYLEQTV
jgi:hypothetical protein